MCGAAIRRNRMKSVFSQKPCDTCCVYSQVGNPYNWERECDRCIKLGQWKNEVLIRLSKIEDILGDEYDLDRLKELVQADREGRCAKLPCKEFFSMLGGDVYAIDDDEVLEVLLCGVGYDPDGIDFIDAVYAPGCEDEKGFTFRFSDVGKTIFLTREEAEAALEKMKEKDKQ